MAGKGQFATPAVEPCPRTRLVHRSVAHTGGLLFRDGLFGDSGGKTKSKSVGAKGSSLGGALFGDDDVDGTLLAAWSTSMVVSARLSLRSLERPTITCVYQLICARRRGTRLYWTLFATDVCPCKPSVAFCVCFLP